MPLTRANVTVASRVMLPAYTGLTAIVGVVYTFDPLHRLAGVSALAVPRMLMPMTGWGLVFFGVAAIMVAAFLSSRRDLFVLALYLCASTFLLWGLMYAGSVVTEPTTSVLAPVYPLFVVVCCYASAKSLLRGERD